MRFLLSLCLVFCCAQAVAERTDVVPLRHKIAEEIAPALRQTFPEASFQSFNGQLIVRAPDEVTFRRIVDLVARLDTRARTLRITVEQRESDSGSDSRVDAQGQVVISNRGSGGELTISGDSREYDRNVVSRQMVSTLDGSRAWIELGSQRFIPMISFVHRPGYRIVTHGGVWQSAGTGFQVEPHLLGEQVQLRLAPQTGRLLPQGAASVSSIYSEVQGRIGEWLPVGESTQEADRSGRGLFSRSGSQSVKRYTVWVRVDATD